MTVALKHTARAMHSRVTVIFASIMQYTNGNTAIDTFIKALDTDKCTPVVPVASVINRSYTVNGLHNKLNTGMSRTKRT